MWVVLVNEIFESTKHCIHDQEQCISQQTTVMHVLQIIFSNTLKREYLQYIPRNMHTVFALLCFVVVIHWLIFPYPSGLLHWHCGNLTIAPVPAKQPWWIWINTSCEFIMNDCITTTKQITTKPCAYFLGYTVVLRNRYSRLLLTSEDRFLRQYGRAKTINEYVVTVQYLGCAWCHRSIVMMSQC